MAEPPPSNGHVWAEWKFTKRTLICCNNCGIVRRADDSNKLCRGKIRVGLRATTANPKDGE
jgi:hypothetical protein